MEDSDGFMWVGTDKGLCRYNGAVWEVWDIDNGMPGNYINKILSDHHSGLWLGLAEKGIFHFNCNNKKVTKVPIIPNGLNHLSIKDNGDLQIDQTDIYKKTNSTWHCKYNDVGQAKKINEVAAVETNMIYNDTVSKTSHLFLLGNRKLLPVNNFTYKHIVTHDWRKIKVLDSLGLNSVSNFIIDNNFVMHFYNDPSKDTLLLFRAFTSSKIFNPSLDTKETLYVAKPGIGLYAIRKSDNSIVEYNAENGLTNLTIQHIYKSKDGGLYIATLGGGLFVLQQNARNRFTVKQLPVRHFQINNGFYYGLANGTIYKYNSYKIISETFIRKDVLSFYISNDSLLIGSFEGLHYYSYKNNRATLLKTFVISAGISSIIPYHKKWLFSTYGGGFRSTKDFVSAEVFSEKLPFANIEKTVALKNGYASLSYEDGFFTCDHNLKPLQRYNTQNGLLSNYAITVHQQNDTLWAGCKNGLSLIKNNKVVKTISYKEGFRGKMAKYIFVSNKNILWVLSDTYLHTYSQGQLKAISSGGILASKNDFVTSALYDSHSDNLLIGTERGLSVLKLSGIVTNKTTTAPELSQAIADNKIKANKEKFEVSYNTNDLVFRFKPMGNLLFAKTDLYYRLNKNEWIKASDSLTVNFNKLRTGNYKLLAKTINADGYESEPALVSTFKINKPWWQQWWFIILYSFALLFIIYSIIQYLNRRKQEQLLQKLQLQQELETERQRISRDLHDNMGAYTSALIANVQQLKNKAGNTEDVQKMQSNAEQILASLRETIWVLNNKEISIQEFNDGFKNYCFKILKNFDHISFEGTEAIENNILLTAATAIQLNKIMQEAVQNIIKHSTATQIKYSIVSGQQLTIRISDNGKGFDEATIKKNGNGLENMRWRAAEVGFRVQVDSETNQGTTITLNTL
jgi:signal transduction histidine kinase